MRRIRAATALTVMCLAAVGTALADDFRCGSRIITVGMMQSEIAQYCGQPTSKNVEQVPVRAGKQLAGETTVEYWTYASSTLTRVLAFDQGKLVSIQQK